MKRMYHTLAMVAWVAAPLLAHAAPQVGVCGSAAGTVATLTPHAQLCSAGVPGAVTGDASAWRWSCQAPDGDAACQAPVGYTKISHRGQALPASAALGAEPDDWACTRDESTGRIWEVKTAGGLRGQTQKFSWFDANPATNGGGAGVDSGGSCHTPGRCDTEKYVQDVNAVGLCGATDWRMPTKDELWALRDTRLATRPEIHHDFFPLTPPATVAWSGTPFASDARFSYCVSFNGQGELVCPRHNAYHVRLVRTGQALAPVLSDVALQGATSGGAVFQAASSQAGTGWWMVVPRGSAAPTPAQVKAQAGYGGVVPAAQGSAALAAATPARFAVSGLAPATDYDFYLVAEAAGQLSAPAQKVAFRSAPAMHAIHTSATPAAGGAVACTPNPVAQGQDATCTAAPAPGYRLVEWTGDCSGAGTCTLAAVDGPRQAGALFVQAAEGLTVPDGPWQGQPLRLEVVPGQGWELAAVATHRAADAGGALPPGLRLPHGAVSVLLNQGPPGGTAQVVLVYPGALPPGTVYYKFGPTPDQPQPHWHPFAGARIDGNRITLTLTDGGAGDGDLQENGSIQDPGGPALLAPPGAPAGAQAIPTLGAGGALLLTLLAALAAWPVLRRARPAARG